MEKNLKKLENNMHTVTYSKLGMNGRLGNQLFQIAATIAFAKDHNMDFAFPQWKYSKYMSLVLPELKESPHSWQRFEEPQFHHSPIPAPPVAGNVDLYYGYYQSEKYFAHHRQLIKSYFFPKSGYQKHIVEKYPVLLTDHTCSIHVRHGDYLKDPYLGYHGVLPIEYYTKAAEFLYGGNLNGVRFVICSDDLPWCKENFKFPLMQFVEGEEDIIDMITMSYCRDHIISNSSFPWWSAWLNSNPIKRVVAPVKLFNNVPLNTNDWYCRNWIKL